MKVVTANPVMIDAKDINYNGYEVGSSNNPNLANSQVDYSAGGVSVKTVNPIFVDNSNVNPNEFYYQSQTVADGQDLTPMDEFLYSYADGKEKLGTLPPKKATPIDTQTQTSTKPVTTAMTYADYLETIKDVPNGPTAAQQKKAAEKGKFWNKLKGNWQNFKKTDEGKLLVQTGIGYLQNKLEQASPSGSGQTYEEPTSESTPMSTTTKIVLAGVGILILGAIIFSIAKGKTPQK